MSKIEWVRNADGSEGKTWNPIRARNKKTGRIGHHCEHVHEGCRFCYAERLNLNARNLPFGGTGLPYKPGHLADVEIFLDEKKLLEPLSWRAPQRVFVNSMDDLYGHWVTGAMRDRVVAVMALCPQHTFIIVTKRPERQFEYLAGDAGEMTHDRVCQEALEIWSEHGKSDSEGIFEGDGENCIGLLHWPLKNVWGLVSCSTQEDADKFIPILLKTPLAMRGVSAEPLLGPIDMRPYLVGHEENGVDLSRAPGSIVGACIRWTPPLDWVIAGGESGNSDQDVRPVHVADAHSLRDQCRDAGVPFFFKQWGEYAPVPIEDPAAYTHGGKFKGYPFQRIEGYALVRFGKKGAGRKLDGVEHNEWPEVSA